MQKSIDLTLRKVDDSTPEAPSARRTLDDAITQHLQAKPWYGYAFGQFRKSCSNGRCANRGLSQRRGSPHPTVPIFVPTGCLVTLVSGGAAE